MQIGPYRVTTEIARGGMGVVYRATDPATGRDVAIKMLLSGDRADEVQRSRFQREAEALARLRHPNIVSVHSVGEERGAPYLVMDFVPGRELTCDSGLPPRDAARIASRLASALQHAHEHGVIHRDVKPANVLIQDGEPKLTDFGLAKDLDARNRLTKTGQFLGTPGFLAPEQARGEPAGPAADVYGLGATLYALLTGQPPFTGESLLEIMAAMVSRPPEPPSTFRPEVDSALDAICLRCLEPKPSGRYPSAQALGDDLERFLAGEPLSPATRSGPRWARRVAAAGSLVLVTAGVLAGSGVGRSLDSAGQTPRPAATTPVETPSVDVKAQIAEARRHLKARALREALRSLADVPEPPPELVWEINQRQSMRSLDTGDVAEALACLQEPASQRSFEGSGAAMDDARAALAREALAKAKGMFSHTTVSPGLAGLARMTEYLHLARALLPRDRFYGKQDLDPMPQLIVSQLGFDPDDPVKRALMNLALACAGLGERDPALLAEVVATSLAPISREERRRLLPYARILAKESQALKIRVLVAGLLLDAGERDEALAAAKDVLSEDLKPATRARMFHLRSKLHHDAGEYDAALLDAERAVALAPSAEDYHMRRVKTLEAQDRVDEAVEALCVLLPGSGPITNTGPFTQAAERLWDLGGRTKRPIVMRDTIRRLLERGSVEDGTLWWIRVALVERATGNRQRARAALAAALATLDRPDADAIAPLITRASAALGATKREGIAGVESLLEHYEAAGR